MTVFNYIFIFFITSFGSIESKVHLNEVMADPTPTVGMPDREYLELCNTGSSVVSLKNWVVELGSKQKILPDVTIEPLGFLLITSVGGAKDLQPFGKVLEISGFGITNTGMLLSLYDANKQLIDRLNYNPNLHRKGCEEGGFSLERIDPERTCGASANWVTTLSPRGGTPGIENSVKSANMDHTAPQIEEFHLVGSNLLEVQFSERIMEPSQWAEVIRELSGSVVTDSVRLDTSASLLRIWFNPATILDGGRYQLMLHGLQDECGNLMSDRVVHFGYYTPGRSDLLINEVLFNPFPEGEDFVEIYNNCTHEVDLSGLFLATRDEANLLKQISPLSNTQRYLAPGGYLALTKSPEGVVRHYQIPCEDCIMKMEKFPTLSDVSGKVILLGKLQLVLDEMQYSDAMHDPFITETEGISLERSRFDIGSAQSSNWHSASKSVGFATPGYQNSAGIVRDSAQTNELIAIDPVIFSPNGDGIHDELEIHLHPGTPDWILNITILNSAGRVINCLANNLSIGAVETLIWNGLDSDFQKVQPGIYLLNVTFFNHSGACIKKRAACVVTDHL